MVSSSRAPASAAAVAVGPQPIVRCDMQRVVGAHGERRPKLFGRGRRPDGEDGHPTLAGPHHAVGSPSRPPSRRTGAMMYCTPLVSIDAPSAPTLMRVSVSTTRLRQTTMRMKWDSHDEGAGSVRPAACVSTWAPSRGWVRPVYGLREHRARPPDPNVHWTRRARFVHAPVARAIRSPGVLSRPTPSRTGSIDGLGALPGAAGSSLLDTPGVFALAIEQGGRLWVDGTDEHTRVPVPSRHRHDASPTACARRPGPAPGQRAPTAMAAIRAEAGPEQLAAARSHGRGVAVLRGGCRCW